MQARLLLGPAGSGKTHRCLSDIRAALKDQADGPPLVLLAPKQATFQLERQLLASGELSGYTRLHIFSFERLARYVLEKLSIALPGQLNEEGRIMVLRALLFRHEQDLKVFGPSARRPGFAQQLGQLLGALQQYQFTPGTLRTFADEVRTRPELRNKLRDLALMLEAYQGWLTERGLQDTNYLLDFGATHLRRITMDPQPMALSFGGMWLDGFAEMTPQELDLLLALLPCSTQATLAFCLDQSPGHSASSWLSIWSAVGRTFQQCRQRLERLPGCTINVELLGRDVERSRFGQSPPLRHLEENWCNPPGNDASIPHPEAAITLTACVNAQAEALFAARQILRLVRGGKRFRDCAVIVRNLDAYHKPLACAFHRYNIPFFLDRRESVTHHPLAELTRSALRTVIFDWRPDDWFAALKAGFSPAHESEIDWLENAALEFGWQGAKWRGPIQIPGDRESTKRLQDLLEKIIPPFASFASGLVQHKGKATGPQLANAIRRLWEVLGVEETLEKWSLPDTEITAAASRYWTHSTVWEQMNHWLDNVALAFPNEELLPGEWLPIVEAGLANLTVGVVPPALDQVLIGAVDRARNPDLKLVFVLGVNQGVFPAAPPAPPILTRADCDELEHHGGSLGLNVRESLARERYLGYIACTRAREKVFLTYSRHDAAGKPLNASSLVTHLQRLFPDLVAAEFHPETDWREARHRVELAAPLIHIGRREGEQAVPGNWRQLLQLPALVELKQSLDRLREPLGTERLSPVLADALYGPVLQTSVSSLEEFAQCPFRFFVHSGLRAEERKVFELDARERGSFQHEVLRRFHEQLVAEQKRWRDLTPAEARQRIGNIAATLAPDYRDGLLRADDKSRFTARILSESLQDFVETLVRWMHGQYEFDPVRAELGFGFEAAGAPAWCIDLDNGHRLALRGRIDRIDLCRAADGRALGVVMDYKSGQRKLDKILVEHGIQLQLLAYLAAIRQWPNTQELLKVERLIPAGVFYVNLRGQYDGCDSRSEALASAGQTRCLAYRHTGRFSVEALKQLDNRPGIQAGDQFNFRRTNNGSLHKGSIEALSHAEFEALLDRVQIQLTEMGRAIFQGVASVDPYRKGADTACRYCDYGGVCRIDPWTHRYRVLRAAPKEYSG